MNPALAGYSPLLIEAASTLPAEYDFVGDGLSTEERNILDWADSRLFRNPAFLASRWGPDYWPAESYEYQEPLSGLDPSFQAANADLRLASVQALVLMMLEIDVQKKANGEHVVGWSVDSLDRVLDGLQVYPGLCVHCYGKTGYDTREGVRENYGPLIYESGHGHREMLKAFAYFARADGEGILIRGLLGNDASDFDMLHKRGRWRSPIGAGSFNYGNVSFMSQIWLPGEGLVSYPTMAFRMAGNARTEREAVERV